jgi:ferritin-like metal-binding protein YciE
VAFGILYKAASTLGRKRKKRGLNQNLEDEEEEDGNSLVFKFQDFLWHGKH